MSAKKSTVKKEQEILSEAEIKELKKLADRTTAKMMRAWYTAEVDGHANPEMFEAIKNLSVAKKSFLAGSSGKKSMTVHLDRLSSKIRIIKASHPHLIALQEIINESQGMPADEFSELIDETRGHWLQDGPKAD